MDTGVGSAWRNTASRGDSARVVLVDDHLLLVDVLRLVLETHGFEDVTTVTQFSPEAIVGTVTPLAPCVIVLDLDLGRFGSSLPLVRPMVDAGATVIAMSDELDIEGLAAALQAGAAGVMSKADGPERLVALLLDVVRGTSVVCGPARVELTDALAERRACERRSRERFERLSASEREVLALLATGLSPDQIAARRFVSLTTVRTQIRSVLSKLGVKSQLAAVALVHQEGWSADFEFA